MGPLQYFVRNTNKRRSSAKHILFGMAWEFWSGVCTRARVCVWGGGRWGGGFLGTWGALAPGHSSIYYENNGGSESEWFTSDTVSQYFTSY